jgi:two-component system cell cycle sensor histidine kinase/response regulator CckA
VEFSPIRDHAGRIIGAVQLMRDVTNERRRQQAEAQARRDESVGQLAGGIAHDFNNIITGILAYAALLEQSLEPGDERRLDVVEIERAASRAAELTSQLLAYARRQEVAPRDVDPNDVLQGAQLLLRRLIGAELELVVDLAPGAWRVRVDPAQLERVLVNLAINARDAMPEGGRLHIASANVTMQAADLPQMASGAGDYVRIDVSDAGHGIPPELFENIFEPFFTTKAIGKGTGLGLASVFGVLQQSGGAISVESAVGSGTTFSVFLPRFAEAPAQS